MIRISIVTISYNQARFLPTVFASVLDQMGPQDEHIIVDAGSSDDSRRLISSYAADENRCRPVFEKDRGPADGLNRGVSVSTGDVLAYVNADDWLLPGALAYVRRYFEEHPEKDVLIGAIKIADEEGLISWRGRVPDYPTPARLTAGICQYYQQGTFFRRSAYQRTKGFNVENRTCWDREIIMDFAVAGARFYVTSRPLGVFRIHGQSITGSAGNSVAYAADSERIRRKATETFGLRLTFGWIGWLQMEARLNPWRWIKQLRLPPPAK